MASQNKTDKHGFRRHRMPRLRFLLHFLLTVVVCGYALHRCSLSASAASESVTLTPAQTLALFGNQITGLLHPVRQGTQTAITFDYAFPLSSIGYMDDGGGFSISEVYDAVNPTVAKQELSQYFGNCDGLVYIASSSQWGGVDTEPYSTYGWYGDPEVQLHCPFSISLQGIGGIQQGILFSSQNYLNSTYDKTPYNSCVSTWIFSDSNLTIDAMRGKTFAGLNVPAVLNLPTYQYYSSTYNPDTGMTTQNTLDTSQTQKMAGFYINTEEQPGAFDLRGITIDCYGVTNASSGVDLWIVVTCPTLWAYEPPVVTTTAPPETVPVTVATYPVYTMPDTFTDTPQNVINNNLITNNYQLNFIIGQLNLIYNQLKISGELDLKLARELDSIETNAGLAPPSAGLQGFVNSALVPETVTGESVVTTSGLALQNVFGAYFDLAKMPKKYGWLAPFAAVGGFCLGFAVLSWALWRGKGV